MKTSQQEQAFLDQSLIMAVYKTRLIHRDYSLKNAVAERTSDEIRDCSDALLERIIAFYKRASINDLGESMWSDINALQSNIHEALITANIQETRTAFTAPGDNELFYGYDFLRKTCNSELENTTLAKLHARLCLDGLVSFAESIGIEHEYNPEAWSQSTNPPYNVEDVVNAILTKAWKFSLPKVFPNEFGLKTPIGVVSYRTPHSLYQAWKIKSLLMHKKAPRVLEIGAGLGRTAYYARELGVKDYTIVDLPLTATASSFYLSQSVGEDSVELQGEIKDDYSSKIKVVTPEWFFENSSTYDLIVNVDSLTEMDRGVALNYLKASLSRADKFLSINHESNSFTVSELCASLEQNHSILRSKHWMRRGYVEELISP